MTFQELLLKERELTKLANQVAENAHRGQTRNDSSTPYIIHPRAVAYIAKQLAVLWQKEILESLADAGWNFTEGVTDAAGNFELYVWEIFLLRLEQVCLLHDVVEDTDVTIEDLIGYGFHSTVIDGIRRITKNPVKGAEDYLSYLLRVLGNIYSRLGKIADLTHNSSDLKPGNMKDKYTLAKNFLSYRPIVPPTR